MFFQRNTDCAGFALTRQRKAAIGRFRRDQPVRSLTRRDAFIWNDVMRSAEECAKVQNERGAALLRRLVRFDVSDDLIQGRP
jgi:hypothetical protein